MNSIPTISIMLIAIILPCIFFTWYLTESSNRYPLIVIEVGVVVLIYLFLTRGNQGQKYSQFMRLNCSLPKMFSFQNAPLISATVLIVFSFILLVSGFSNILPATIHMSIGFLTASFLVGYVIARILPFSAYLSTLEIVILSFVLSYAFSGFSILMLLPLEENSRVILLPCLYLAIGTILIIKNNRRKQSTAHTVAIYQRPNSFGNRLDVLAIIVPIIFYLVFITNNYPDLALVQGLDITEHYQHTSVLLRAPESYLAFYYLLFHGFQGALVEFSGGADQISIISFQSMQMALIIFLPMSVYALSRRFLVNIDQRIPPLATICYCIFTNLSFIYLVEHRSSDQMFVSELDMLEQLAEVTFNGPINLLQPVHFFTPMTVGMIFFVFALLMLRVQSMPNYLFVLACSILIVGMYFTHVVESIVFGIIISTYSFFFRNKALRLDNMLVSCMLAYSIIGFVVVSEVLFWDTQLREMRFNINTIFPFLIPLLLTTFTFIWRKKVFPSLENRLFRTTIFFSFDSFKKHFYTIICAIVVIVYLGGFITGLFIEDFVTSATSVIGVVPWFVYPLTLGIVGLLGALSIKYLKDMPRNNILIFLLISILVVLVLGRIITFTNTNITMTGYWERRFLSFSFLFASLLAPIPLIKLADHVSLFISKKRGKHVLIQTAFVLILTVIVVYGFSSSLLQASYWSGYTDKYRITEKEFEALDYLKGVLHNDRNAFLITSSSAFRSEHLALAAPEYILSKPELVFSSKNPVVPLLALDTHGMNHPYLYLHKRDMGLIETYKDSWLVQYLIPSSKTIFSNEDVTIYNITKRSPPLPNSDAAVVIPTATSSNTNYNNSWFRALDIISTVPDINYTVTGYDDPLTLNSESIILTFDPQIDNNLIFNFTNTTGSTVEQMRRHNWNTVSGEWHIDAGLFSAMENKTYHEKNRSLGVKNDSYYDSIIMSTISAENLNTTISTSVKISESNKNEPKYFFIVYGYKDRLNYKAAIALLHDNKSYINFVNVDEGRMHFVYPWKITQVHQDLDFSKDAYNLSLSIRNNTETISLNKQNDQKLGKLENKYATPSSKIGYVGLGQSPNTGIIFNNLDILQQKNAYTENLIEGYYDYLKSGQKMIVLNSNGYGAFADHFNIAGSLNSNSTGCEELSVYSSPRILECSNLVYIDFHYQGAKGTGSNNPKLNIEDILPLNKSSSVAPLFPETVHTGIRTFNSKSDLQMLSQSMSLSSDKPLTLNLSSYSEDLSFRNVSKVYITSPVGNVVLTGRDTYFTSLPGDGLYSRFFFPNYSEINVNPNGGDVILVSDLETRKYSNISEVTFLGGDNFGYAHVTARYPSLSLSGITLLRDVFSAPLYFTLGERGDMRSVGKLDLSIYASDQYKLLDDIKNGGDVDRIPPLANYDESSSFFLPEIFTNDSPAWTTRLVSLPVFALAFLFIFYINGENRTQKNRDDNLT